MEGNLSRDFYRFIGLHIAMSLYPMVGERRDFWAVEDREFSLHRTMKFGDYLSKHRFDELESRICFGPEEPEDTPVESQDPF